MAKICPTEQTLESANALFSMVCTILVIQTNEEKGLYPSTSPLDMQMRNINKQRSFYKNKPS